MKSFVVVVFLSLTTSVYAGWFSFAADVASVSTALSSNSGVQEKDLKKVNQYLWDMVEAKKYTKGYELLAQTLEKSNDLSYLDTAAVAYFDNGQKEKAIEIYELRILPTARAVNPGLERTYKRIVGLDSSQQIDYEKIYERYKDEQDSKKPQESSFSVLFVLWAIFFVLLLNLLVKIGLVTFNVNTKKINIGLDK
jgi:tetratricopeptide (TPR) repeat protein